jgi:hypothetical protein
VSAGAVTAFWPYYEDMKQAAMERGIAVNDGYWEAFFEGFPSMAVEYVTGNEYNIGSRYGPQGLSILKELANGETTFFEMLGGASGSITLDIVRGVEPVFAGIVDVFQDEQGALPLLMEDFIDLTSNISSVNNTLKLLYVLNTGRYLSKNEIYMDDIDTWDSLFMGITGLSPRDLTDTFIKIESGAELRAAQDIAKKEIVKYLRRGFQAHDNEERIAYFKRAKANLIAAGFLKTQWGGIISEAFNGNESIIDKINRDFYILKAPADQIQERQEFYRNQVNE